MVEFRCGSDSLNVTLPPLAGRAATRFPFTVTMTCVVDGSRRATTSPKDAWRGPGWMMTGDCSGWIRSAGGRSIITLAS
jgi:hypothetical protein